MLGDEVGVGDGVGVDVGDGVGVAVGVGIALPVGVGLGPPPLPPPLPQLVRTQVLKTSRVRRAGTLSRQGRARVPRDF